MFYYAKGKYAGRGALCREWIAGNLGRLLGLPIPEFAIAAVPSELVRYSAMADIADLGAGPVFASQLLEDAQEFSFSDIPKIDSDLQMQVVLFDWWVRNEDRTLTELGGNPNLLWANKMGSLGVFDLNLAFDDTFDEARFWQMHVFNGAVSSWPSGFRDEMTKRMEVALKELPRIWGDLPAEWLHEDGDRAGAAVLNFDAVSRLLNRFREVPDDFWAIRK